MVKQNHVDCARALGKHNTAVNTSGELKSFLHEVSVVTDSSEGHALVDCLKIPNSPEERKKANDLSANSFYGPSLKLPRKGRKEMSRLRWDTDVMEMKLPMGTCICLSTVSRN